MEHWRAKAEKATPDWLYTSQPMIPAFHHSSIPNLGPGPKGWGLQGLSRLGCNEGVSQAYAKNWGEALKFGF